MRVHAPEAGEVSVPADVLAGFDQSVNHVVEIGDHNARVPLAVEFRTFWPFVEPLRLLG